jgi:hypothetical protein
MKGGDPLRHFFQSFHLMVSHHRIDFDAILDKLKDAPLKMPECL